VNLSLLYPPNVVGRLLDDVHAIADAVRILPRLERELTQRLDGLREEMAPIQELSAVREAVASLPDKLDGLREEMAPIQELSAVRVEIEAMRAVLETVSDKLEKLDALRAGIEPLDEDLHAVRESVDTLEPLMSQVNSRMEALTHRITALRSDLAPLGELAEKVPGIG
jgi:uncharacterized coiled-coil DUF342 family protein